MRYAVVNEQSDIVENCIMWDGDETIWKCPQGFYLVESLQAGIGDVYNKNDNEFSRKLSLLKPLETEKAKADMRQFFEEKKEELKSGLLFIDPEGNIEI